ncbi:hypothetical protein [Actinomadura harenae]|uniref:CU044_5270 family protein n=1 Tax=Actinomadura harenae TaxID=2483351 RepID=A0A3M2LWV8_9ACTN|nr:hypothetical protein [Actinomadura harenae]RMI41817.1 hypothetical protein EBO15_22010 [Actinomadura harenae]
MNDDDLDTLRDLRRDPPPMDASVRDGIRANLLTLTDGAPEPARAPRAGMPRRAVLPIAAAALLIVGIGVGAAVVRDTGGASGGIQAASYHRPGPHQWIYVKRTLARGSSMSTWNKGVILTVRAGQEEWYRVDGQAVATIDQPGGRLHVSKSIGKAQDTGPAVLDGAYRSPYSFANYGDLPRTPDALLRHLSGTWDPSRIPPQVSENVFVLVTRMLRDPLPLPLRQELFELLPRIPGVVVRPGLTDLAGRRGDGFSFTDGGERQTLIIEPGSFRLLGTGRDSVADHRVAGGLVKKGTVLESTAVLECKVVDEAGRR